MNLKEWKRDVGSKSRFATYKRGMFYIRFNPLLLFGIFGLFVLMIHSFFVPLTVDVLKDIKVIRFFFLFAMLYVLYIHIVYMILFVQLIFYLIFKMKLVFDWEEFKEQINIGVLDVVYVFLLYVVIRDLS